MSNTIRKEIEKGSIRTQDEWIIKYFVNQIKLCLVFNYYFPYGNYRNYFDFYMLETIKFTRINFFSYIKQFSYNDFENDQGILVNAFLNKFVDLIQEYKDVEFNNNVECFIFIFNLACKCYDNNDELEIREKTGDFFVYKFSGPFIENEGTEMEGHITNGYIGQFIRYISLKQSSYFYKGQYINKPYHFVWRDAHTNCIAYNDYLWISELNNRYNNEIIYFLPISIGYERMWHENVKCDVNDLSYKRTAIAGVVQMINPNFSQDDNLYLKTIGLPFIINVKQLPLKEARRDNDKYLHYKYGIDEYILSSLFIEDEIKKYSIYFNYKMEDEIFNFSKYKYSNEKNYFYYLITAQVLILNILKIVDKPKIIDVIKKIEELRESKDIKNTALGFLLSMIPNKYHIGDILFSYSIPIPSIYDEPGYHEFSIYTTTLDLDDINKIYTNNNTKMIEKLKNINSIDFNFETLKYFGINCTDNLIINSVLEWCQHAYIKKLTPNTIDCTSANYYSGFYNEKPPSLDIGILRQPSDLIHAVNALYNNNLKLKLNKSDYKLNVKTKNLITDIEFNKDNYNNIKPLLQIIIFNFSDGEKSFAVETIAIAAFKNLINQNQDSDKLKNLKSQLWSSLIWKALNYSGYDIPSEWFNIHLDDNEKYYQFNEYVKKLSKIQGWAEYALEVLIKDKEFYKDAIKEDFMSKNVKTISKKYFDSYKRTNFNKYKMDTHDYMT